MATKMPDKEIVIKNEKLSKNITNIKIWKACQEKPTRTYKIFKNIMESWYIFLNTP